VALPVRILAVSAAAPSLRLAARDVASAWGRSAGTGQSGICAPDEDTLTLAAEAGLGALTAAGIAASGVDGLWWGTTRPPFAEGPSHAVLAGALGLSRQSGGALTAGSPHAGMDALLAAADAIAAGSARIALVITSDALVPGLGSGFEARCGAGAAAVVLAAEGGDAAITARVTRTQPLLDRYRGDSESATRDLYDPRLFREEMFLPVVREVGEHLAAFAVNAWSLPDPDGRLGATVAKQIGATNLASSGPYAAVGDTAAAAPLLGGIGALDAAGAVAIVATGGGRTTGIIITADAPVPGAASVAEHLSTGRPATYAEVLRARGQLAPSGELIPMGVPPESAMFARGAEEMLQLLGGRCTDCGTINTPPSIHPACIACGGTKMEPVPLARRGVVHTFVVNQTMPAPFVAPLPIAVIDLEDGARIMLQVVGDGDGLAIGTGVELVLRRYAHERGVPVYGWKARALPDPTSTTKNSSAEGAR
jgi:hydroxymethylglutaryl-CoA synthase